MPIEKSMVLSGLFTLARLEAWAKGIVKTRDKPNPRSVRERSDEKEYVIGPMTLTFDTPIEAGQWKTRGLARAELVVSDEGTFEDFRKQAARLLMIAGVHDGDYYLALTLPAEECAVHAIDEMTGPEFAEFRLLRGNLLRCGHSEVTATALWTRDGAQELPIDVKIDADSATLIGQVDLDTRAGAIIDAVSTRLYEPMPPRRES